MPRRLIRNSKLTNRQLNEFVKYFALEVPASRAANVMGINWHSAERVYQVIRRRLARECELHSPLGGEVEHDESYFGGRRKGPTMALSIFLEMETEGQLIPTADRDLPKPPVISQQIHPSVLGLCLKTVQRFSQRRPLPAPQPRDVSIPTEHPDAAIQINFHRAEWMTRVTPQAVEHRRQGEPTLLPQPSGRRLPVKCEMATRLVPIADVLRESLTQLIKYLLLELVVVFPPVIPEGPSRGFA